MVKINGRILTNTTLINLEITNKIKINKAYSTLLNSQDNNCR